jgi:hypothetical protein
MERADHAVVAAQHHDGLVEGVEGEELPRLGQLVDVPDAVPGRIEDALALRLEDLLVVEIARRQGERVLRGGVGPIEGLDGDHEAVGPFGWSLDQRLGRCDNPA